jgi:hypothetical protein
MSGSDQESGGVDRRSFVSGALATLGIVGGIATIATAREDDEESDRPAPSSNLLKAEAEVSDFQKKFCSIHLLVDVGASERVVIQNDMDGDTDRTVQNSGERILTTTVPVDSTVLIYAVDLDANTSKTLKTYRVSEDCTLSEVGDGAE